MAQAYQSRESIENFKSALANGGVRPTMFEVNISFPEIVANAIGVAGAELSRKATFLVKASTMPGSQIGVIDVPFRGRKLKVSGDRQFNDWSTTIINDSDFKLRRAMEKWSEIIQYHNFALGHNQLDTGSNGVGGSGQGYFGQAQVRQLNRQGEQLRMYEFNGIWPYQMGEINLDFETNDTIEEYDVTFCVQYWHAGGRFAEGGDLGGNFDPEPENQENLIIFLIHRGVKHPSFFITKY